MSASTTGRDGSAVVIGAGIAGLLAARVLAEHVGEVTVLDRDRLPEEAVPRGGAPQSAHAHGLLARGLRALEELHPGLTAELVARGAEPGDLQGNFHWIFDGRPLARGSSGLQGLLVSRGLLEREIRRRTAADPRIRIVDGVEVTGLAHDGRGRVLGVESLVRDDPQGRMVPRWDADLVVDASGRSSRAPEWLASMGFARPVEDRVQMDMAYATRHYRREPHHLGGAFGVSVGASPDVPRGGVLLAQEGDRWICTLAGYAGNRPPVDPEGFEAFAASLASPMLSEAISGAEPLDEPRRFRIPASVRRRYERLQEAPLGLLVLGDAVCSFNPVYGQGMTVAATEALILRDLLRSRSGRDLGADPSLARQFWRAIASAVEIPWQIAVGADLRMPGVQGRPDLRTRLVNAYIAKVHRAAALDSEVGAAFLRVANLDAPPPNLMTPALMARVFRAARRAPAVPVPQRVPVPV